MAYRAADPAGAFATALTSTMSSLAQADEIALRVGERNDKHNEEDRRRAFSLITEAMRDPETGEFNPGLADNILNTPALLDATGRLMASADPTFRGKKISQLRLVPNPNDPDNKSYALMYQDNDGGTQPIIATKNPNDPEDDEVMTFSPGMLTTSIAGALAAANPEAYAGLLKSARDFKDQIQDATGVATALETLGQPRPSPKPGLSTAAGVPGGGQPMSMPAGPPSLDAAAAPGGMAPAPQRQQTSQQPTPEAEFLPPGEDLTTGTPQAPQDSGQGPATPRAIFDGKDWNTPDQFVVKAVGLWEDYAEISRRRKSLEAFRTTSRVDEDLRMRNIKSLSAREKDLVGQLAEANKRAPDLTMRAKDIATGSASDAKQARRAVAGKNLSDAVGKGLSFGGSMLSQGVTDIADIARSSNDAYLKPAAEAASDFFSGFSSSGGIAEPTTLSQAATPQSQPQAAAPQEEDRGFGFSEVDPSRAKTAGWFGPLATPSGKAMTELSTTVEFDNREMEIPLVNPLLTEKELRFLQRNADDPRKVEMPDSILQKAEQWALQRLRAGRSPYPTDEETAARQAQLKERGFSADLPAAPKARAATPSRSTNRQGETVWQAPPPKTANPSPAQVAASNIKVSGPVVERMSDDQLKALTTRLGRLVARGKMDFAAAGKLVQRAAGTEPLEVKVADNRILSFDSDGNLVQTVELGTSLADQQKQMFERQTRQEENQTRLRAAELRALAAGANSRATSEGQLQQRAYVRANFVSAMANRLFQITDKNPDNLAKQNWLIPEIENLQDKGVINWETDPEKAQAVVTRLVGIAGQQAAANADKWSMAGLRDTGPTDITGFSLLALLNQTQATAGMPDGTERLQARDFLNVVGEEGRAKLITQGFTNEEIANLVAGVLARTPPDRNQAEVIDEMRRQFANDPIRFAMYLLDKQQGAR